MYALIIEFAILSPATGAVTPVGVTSQTVGEFKTLDQCKAAANEPLTGGTISDLTLSRACIGIVSMPARKARRALAADD